MSTNDAREFAIYVHGGAGRTDHDFRVMTSTGERWTAGRVAGMNVEMQRNNPRDYASGKRYYYLPDPDPNS